MSSPSGLLSRRFAIIVLLGMLASVLITCGTAPLTGRRQFLLLPANQEMAMGLSAFQDIKESAKLSTDAGWTRTIKEVGERIVAQLEPNGFVENFEWEFLLIDDPQVNAFCLPGGKVSFYTGILPLCQDAEGVAVVMGHEIAHAWSRHGNERVSQSQVASVGLSLASVLSDVAFEDASPEVKQLAIAGLGAGVTYGVLMPFSRTHESEADYQGLILMARAGFDPSEAVRFWQRMKTASGGEGGSDWFSTHPSHDRRIAQLQEWLPEAQAIYERVRPR